MTTDITEKEYNRLWATNVAGTFNFSKRLTPLINEGEQRCEQKTSIDRSEQQIQEQYRS